MGVRIQHFACTQCGKCCNRSPEVELSEAAGLADIFVFRLMFRMHWLADHPRDSEGASAPAFWERKRLLAAFAAHKSAARLQRHGRTVAGTRYLMISAVTVDTSPGACSALTGTACGIHERRPLSCRTVPFHYSRGELAAEADLAGFAQSDGYACDTSEGAEQVLADGRIVAPAYRAARDQAAALAIRDRPWSAAIVRAMKRRSIAHLPTLADVEASAGFAAATVPISVGWEIAVEAGLLDPVEYDRLVGAQLRTIDRTLASGSVAEEVRRTLLDMRSDCAERLTTRPRIETVRESAQ